MTPEELKALEQTLGKQTANQIKQETEAVKGEFMNELNKLKEGGASKEEFEALVSKFDEAHETIKSQAIELGKLKETAETKGKGLHSEIREHVSKNADALASLKSGNGNKIAFNVKAAGTMTTGNTLPEVETAIPYGLSSFEQGITNIARRQPFLRQIVNVSTISTMYAAWAEFTNHDGGAGNTAEGAAKTQADFDVQEATKKVEKITSYMKTSKENLDDIAAMQAAINTELMELVELRFDAQLLSGNGTSPQLKGLLEYAQSFSVAGTDLAAGVTAANNYDVLRAAAWQIASQNFVPNYFLINPVDAAMMDLSKSTDGIYVIPPFTTANGRRIAGMMGIENNGVTAGQFLVGDFNKSNLRMREEMNISIGYENDDFTKNLVTILAEMRAVHYVKANDVNAFVKGTFAAGIAALQGGGA